MEESTNYSWLDNLINATTTITTSYFENRTAKEAAKVQATINENTLETDKQSKISANTTRNILLIIGGTLGILLVYKTAKKLLK